VRRLPPRQREALILRYFADLDVPEIVRSMGVSPGTVKSTLSRGIAALGPMLGGGRRPVVRAGGRVAGDVQPHPARWVSGTWEADQPADRPRRRLYEMTALGRAELAAGLAARPRVRVMWGRLAQRGSTA
jgi:hypothetical protein